MKTRKADGRPLRLLKQKRGSTIVEIMVGFVVLMMMLALFSQIIAMANRMLQSAKWMTDEQERFSAYYYSNTYGDQKQEVTPNGGSLQFSLQLDSSKTSTLNYSGTAPAFALGEVTLEVYQSEAGMSEYFFDNSEETPEGETP